MSDERKELKIDDVACPVCRVLCHVEAVRRLAHEVHYNTNVRGAAFYALHLLADKFNFDDVVDALKEAYYIGQMMADVPSDNFVGAYAASIVDAAISNENGNEVAALSMQARNAAYAVEDAKRILAPSLMSGVCAILDEISKKALVLSGLVWMSVDVWKD